MERITDQSYWEKCYQEPGPEPVPGAKGGWKRTWRRWVGKVLGASLDSYEDYLLWDVIYQTHLPKIAGLRAVEVGCAPGQYLVRLNKMLGYTPYGIEYTDTGVKRTKEVFLANGLNPDNILHQDFFSEEYHREHRGYFDIVISRGFIEHFVEVENVVQMHLDLVKPGGYLVISVPNFKGVYILWLRLFQKELIPMHNRTIMRKKEFAKLFRDPRLTPKFCNYFGTFNLDLVAQAREGTKLQILALFLHRIQVLLNPILHWVFRRKGGESRWFSPHLLYIGQKDAQPAAEKC